MTRIFIPTWDSFNYGEIASIIGMIVPIRQLIPDAEFTILSPFPEIDRENYEKYDVKVIRIPWISKFKIKTFMGKIMYFGLPILFILLNGIVHRILKPLNIPIIGGIQNCDIYVENLGPAHYNEAKNRVSSLGFYYSFLPLLLMVIINKPFVIYAESVGPFEGTLSRLCARYIFNKAGLITVREAKSFEHLKGLHISKPVHLTADPAFLFLSQCSKEEIMWILIKENITDCDHPILLITPNSQIYRVAFSKETDLRMRQHNYVIAMAKAADYFINKLNGTVLLVSHDLLPGFSDALVCEQIQQESVNKNKIKLIGGKYSVDELKALIGMCQMHIGCRLHSNIASLSMNVPTIPISYSDKYAVIDYIVEKPTIINIRYTSFEQLIFDLQCMIDYTWENRQQIQDAIKERIQEVIKKASLNAKLIKEFADKI